MKILNIHERIIHQPIDKVGELFLTLSRKEDMIWPYELWPRMRLDNGISEGSKGGHGRIGYFITSYIPNKLIEFQFTKPDAIKGVHRLELSPIDEQSTLITHAIDASAHGNDRLVWSSFIAPLHDALIEDAFDKVESNFYTLKQKSKWSIWVRFLRFILK